MSGGPEHSRGIVQIAIALDIHRQASMLAISQRRPYRGRSAIADAGAALAANVLVMFFEIPQPRRPGALEIVGGYQRPILVLDLSPQFSRKPRRGDGAGIPAYGRQFTIPVARLLVGLNDLCAALL